MGIFDYILSLIRRKNYVEIEPEVEPEIVIPPFLPGQQPKIKPIPMPEKILTPEQLTYICPAKKGQLAINWTNSFNKICPQYGIGKNAFEEFIANILEESWELTAFSESLNYSTESLLKTFSTRRISVSDAQRYGRNAQHPAAQVTLAGILYGGKWGAINLGNRIGIDTPYLLRGAGIPQLTGYTMIGGFTQYYNKLNGTNIDHLAMAVELRKPENIDLNVHAASWFFAIKKNLLALANADNLKAVVKAWNGGYNGLERREIYWKRAKQILT